MISDRSFVNFIGSIFFKDVTVINSVSPGDSEWVLFIFGIGEDIAVVDPLSFCDSERVLLCQPGFRKESSLF